MRMADGSTPGEERPGYHRQTHRQHRKADRCRPRHLQRRGLAQIYPDAEAYLAIVHQVEDLTKTEFAIAGWLARNGGYRGYIVHLGDAGGAYAVFLTDGT